MHVNVRFTIPIFAYFALQKIRYTCVFCLIVIMSRVQLTFQVNLTQLIPLMLLIHAQLIPQRQKRNFYEKKIQVLKIHITGICTCTCTYTCMYKINCSAQYHTYIYMYTTLTTHTHTHHTHTHTHTRTHTNTAASYHVLEQGKLICMDCLNRDGPIYHELEVVQSDSELLAEDPLPPVPPRQRPPKPKDPIYERVGSINKHQLQSTRRVSISSEEGSYITSKFCKISPKILESTTKVLYVVVVSIRVFFACIDVLLSPFLRCGKETEISVPWIQF